MGSVAGWKLSVPIEKGGREPKLTSLPELAARVIANRRGCVDLSPRSQVRGKTSLSLAVAHLLAQRADDRILVTDVESLRPAGLLRDLPQEYAPLRIDLPPTSGHPVVGPAWEEAMRALGLPQGEDHTR
ncbi:ParA family protein [Streptomyces sp. NPDC052415]|uniref:ParA family protein n=1 Tax=Streptomyces sp. NPDC052415 TaxID=3365690 RepID=UPI0037D5C70C